MTKLIAVLMVVGVLYAGWELFFYWERVKNEEAEQKKAATTAVVPEQLEGMPFTLEDTLRKAEAQGPAGMANFLKTYARSLHDPRKAWIELDYCQMLAREDTSAAKKLFAEIKARTPQNSPIMPRIKQLERTYE